MMDRKIPSGFHYWQLLVYPYPITHIPNNHRFKIHHSRDICDSVSNTHFHTLTDKQDHDMKLKLGGRFWAFFFRRSVLYAPNLFSSLRIRNITIFHRHRYSKLPFSLIVKNCLIIYEKQQFFFI